MTVRRIMGTETEFGISVLGMPQANPMVMSSLVVNAYGDLDGRRRRGRWDYDVESPLRDARGFDMSRRVADPSQLTDDDVGVANIVLPNGARWYVDHAHPEYSSPECTQPLDVVRWDAAGDLVAAAAAAHVQVEGGHPVVLYKNNTDNKGASYGAHENYLVQRSTPFSRIVRSLTPFFVTRQVVCGAGRVGIGQDGRTPGFQISQRSDFFEVEVGLETTLKRPIINTRDEPHADPERWRRLHVIIGDANLAQTSTFLKLGTTSLVLWLIEQDALRDDWTVVEPVESLHAVSHDPSLQHQVRLTDGRTVTALDLQEMYRDAVRRRLDQVGSDPATEQVMATWDDVLDKLRRDPFEARRQLDWVAKLALLESYRSRDRLDWSSPTLALIDLQYADLRPEKGLFARLEGRGAVERLVPVGEVEGAVSTPPSDTRAYFRGRCLGELSDHVAAASWDSVIFDVPGRDSLQRVPTLDPWRGTADHVGELLDRVTSAAELVDAIAGVTPGH